MAELTNVSFCQENDVYLTDGWGNVVFPDGRTFHYGSPYHMIHLLDGLIPFEPDKILPGLHSFEARFGKFGILGCMEGAYTVPTRKWVKDGALFLPIFSGEPPVTAPYRNCMLVMLSIELWNIEYIPVSATGIMVY